MKPVPTLTHQDSGSNTSSCNSSTPSSPALPITSPTSITSPSPVASPQIVVQPSQFQFPGEDPYPRFPLAMPTALFDNFQSACQVCAHAAPLAPIASNTLQRHGSLQHHRQHHHHALPSTSSPVTSSKKSRPPNILLKGTPLYGSSALSQVASRHVYDRKLGLYTYPYLNLTSTQCVHRRSVSTLCFPCFSASSEKPCSHDDDDEEDDDDSECYAGQSIENNASQVFSDPVSPLLSASSASSQTPVLNRAPVLHLPKQISSSLPEPRGRCPESVGVEDQMTRLHRQYAITGNQGNGISLVGMRADCFDSLYASFLTRWRKKLCVYLYGNFIFVGEWCFGLYSTFCLKKIFFF